MDTLTIEEWESKTALNSHLQASGKESFLIGKDVEASRKFFSFTYESELGDFEIGILSSDLGIKPSGIILKDSKTIIIGHDTFLTGIDLTHNNISFTKTLDGVFYEFVSSGADDHIIVIHELGALKIDYTGLEQWSVSTDIVSDFFIDNNKLSLRMMDDDTVFIINIESGHLIKNDSKESGGGKWGRP